METKEICVMCNNSYPVDKMKVIPRGMMDPEPDCGEPDPSICLNCLEELDSFAVSGTVGTCAKCGRSVPTEDLKFIPETEQYIRQVALSHCNGATVPAQLDEEKIREKYGFPYDSMFCPDCWRIF